MFVASFLLRALAFGASLEPIQARRSDIPYTRKYFYVGGDYVSDAAGDHYLKDQMYVEELNPAAGATKPWPLVLIHGFAQTGTVSFVVLIPIDK